VRWSTGSGQHEGVAGVHRDHGDRAIVAASTQLAHAAGSRAVAEGVETEEQRRVLVDLACDVGMGFLRSQPRGAVLTSGRGRDPCLPQKLNHEDLLFQNSTASSPSTHLFRTPVLHHPLPRPAEGRFPGGGGGVPDPPVCAPACCWLLAASSICDGDNPVGVLSSRTDAPSASTRQGQRSETEQRAQQRTRPHRSGRPGGSGQLRGGPYLTPAVGRPELLGGLHQPRRGRSPGSRGCPRPGSSAPPVAAAGPASLGYQLKT